MMSLPTASPNQSPANLPTIRRTTSSAHKSQNAPSDQQNLMIDDKVRRLFGAGFRQQEFAKRYPRVPPPSSTLFDCRKREASLDAERFSPPKISMLSAERVDPDDDGDSDTIVTHSTRIRAGTRRTRQPQMLWLQNTFRDDADAENTFPIRADIRANRPARVPVFEEVSDDEDKSVKDIVLDSGEAQYSFNANPSPPASPDWLSRPRISDRLRYGNTRSRPSKWHQLRGLY